eukprot:Nitzschia sp. Nitz4//scaffold80_size88189//3055//4818//NITZ4_005077-RA/size88189-processed-gene-0.22-mRNA-1//-1//CDS//3329558600//7027//frame0
MTDFPTDEPTTSNARVNSREGGEALEALRKHRERRRATPAGAKKRTKHIDVEHSETSAGIHVPQFAVVQPERTPRILSTVLATGADRESMRKISVLGLEDPVDQVMSSRRKHHQHHHALSQDRAVDHNDMVIHATQSAHDRMRHISILGLEDPADRAQRMPTLEGVASTQQHRRRSDNIAQPSHSFMVTSDREPGSRRRPSPTRGAMARAKSADDAGLFVPMEHRKFQLQRSRKMGSDIPLVEDPEEGSHERDGTKSRGRVSQPLAFQVTIPDPAASSRPTGSKPLGGTIETTGEQQELMRKISALGMYDPVFGNIHKEMEVEAICESEKEDIQSVTQSSDGSNPIGKEANVVSPTVTDTSSSASKIYIPPNGSFNRRVSRGHNDENARGKIIGSSSSTPQEMPTRQFRRAPPRRSDTQTRTSSESGSSNGTGAHAFIPPTGSFNMRKRGQTKPNIDNVVSKDLDLAMKAQSVFPEEFLSDSCLNQSLSNLNASMTFSAHSISQMSTEHSVTSDVPQKRTSGQQHPKRPPQSSKPAATGGRNQPSSSTRGNRFPLTRDESCRSWEGDSDLPDPFAERAWMSLSKLEH